MVRGCRFNNCNYMIILGIESSCDDTSAAVLRGDCLLSNVTASQSVHEMYGGVVPELASRAHQQNIVPVVDAALKKAGVSRGDVSAVAFTRGPGLMGSLIVGTSFAKGFALGLNVPLIDVNHLQAHVMAHFIREEGVEAHVPEFPFLCLLVSGGNSQIVRVDAYNDMHILGRTIDDAAGEAFDKCAKVMGLPYPGGPVVDKLAHEGNPDAFHFARPNIPGLDYSFSGLKTSFLYTVRDAVLREPDFVSNHLADLCASLQHTIIEVLMRKVDLAVRQTGIRRLAVAGGVSANSGLREAFVEYGRRRGAEIFIPKFSYTTDNAAMVGVVGYFKYLDGDFADIALPPFARVTIK